MPNEFMPLLYGNADSAVWNRPVDKGCVKALGEPLIIKEREDLHQRHLFLYVNYA